MSTAVPFRVLVAMLACVFWLFACASGPDSSAGDPNAPRYYTDVAPILNKNCTGCHRQGGIAPFALSDYASVRSRADDIARVTAAREMPPMPVDNSGSCNVYANARWLSASEIDLLGRWSRAGAPAGDATQTPPAGEAPPRLESPDALLDMGISYLPTDDAGHDDYRCFVLPSPLAATRYLRAYEVLPGDARVVHHAIVYQPVSDDAVAAARELDAQDEQLGYRCFGGPGVDAAPLALWAPGAGAIDLPAGTGLPVLAGRALVLQIHYNLQNGSYPDRTRVALAFANEKVTSAQYIAAADLDMRLPPGRENVESTASNALDDRPALTVYGVMPHMHLLGRTLRVDAESEGSARCLVNVDRWDFHWQNAWWYPQPLVLPDVSALSIRCGFDTRTQTSEVRWGENTTDEMCISFFYVTVQGSSQPDPQLSCTDAENPLFGSCFDDLLAGCYEPDLSSTCTADASGVRFGDGTRIVRSGADAGLYAAGSDAACISFTTGGGRVVLTKGDEHWAYAADGDHFVIECPDGSRVRVSGFQLHEYGVCRGLNCPD